MNALKLADKWDAQGFSEYELERECGNQMANMLRQQQAEIEALRNQLWDLKSEPWGFDRHPVKELTDEEIHDLIINKTTDADMIKQALRKAQDERK